MTPLDRRALSKLWNAWMVVVSIGALLFVGALESMTLQAVAHGSALLTFDWLEPTESMLVLPCIMLLLFVNTFVELWRLSK